MTEPHRLPTHIVPSRYELELEPDLETARFRGSVRIDVEILEATDEIVCNAAELDIHTASIQLGHGARSRIVPDVRLDPATERLHLSTRTDLPRGPAHIELAFTGVLNDRLEGFYRSTFADDDGPEHTIATTQFQSTDARRAFPCWDEPAWKATFATTLVVDESHLAVANTAVVRESPADGGRRRVTFAETMPMSTYLVAFVVGPLEVTDPVDVRGVPVRVVHRPGRGHLAPFALEVADHALGWFTDYYGIPYPSDKVDLIAIPDFAAGAMENLGCITFREVLLLVDPAAASQPELQRVADVVNHELAHMWFGDLVTMGWWEGIWLNEAFATFMETACSDAFRPDWRVWTTFGRSRTAAFATDALGTTRPVEYPVGTPEEAQGMFDVLTYEKGASVVRMLEQHLGPDRFREGVRHYLETHAYRNTETSDLWDALEETSGEPVRAMMAPWILQGGYPVIEATPTPHGLRVRQRHFTLDPETADERQWVVPLRIRTPNGVTGVVLDGPEMTLTGLTEPVVTVNADASGFFRVLPTDAAVELVVAGHANADERHALVDDAWALTLAGELEATAFLDLAERVGAGEDDVTVWQALAEGLGGLDDLLSDDRVAAAFRTRVGALANPALDRVGRSPEATDDDRTRELRATLVRLLGKVAHDPDIIAAAPALRESDDATLAAAALAVVSHHGGAEEYADVRRCWKEATDPQQEQRHLRALADFRDPALIRHLIDEIVEGGIRSQDGPYIIRAALKNREVGPMVWEIVMGRWDELWGMFPANSIDRMLEGIVALDTDELVESTTAFLAAHPVPQAENQVAQHLDQQRVRAAFRNRETGSLTEYLVGGP